MIITLLVYIGIELFFVFVYDSFSSLEVILNSLVIIVCSNIIASLLILIIALWINNFTSFSTFETLYGVVIGFFTGVYIPIGYYPSIIRNIFFYFPLCQTTSLLRNIQTDTITNDILFNYPYEQHSILYETFGIRLSLNQNVISIEQQLWMLLIAIILLNLILIFLLQMMRYYR